MYYMKYRYPSVFHQIYYTEKRNLRTSSWLRKIVQTKYRNHTEHTSIQWINPDEIKYMQLESSQTPTKFRHLYNKIPIHEPDKARFNPYRYSGAVLGGDWDMYVKPHKYDRVYRGLKKHITESVPLLQTEYGYQYKLRSDTYQNKEWLKNENHRTKGLINSIKKNGVRSRYELGSLNQTDPPYLQKPQWGITVNIDRNGEYIFNNTAHNRLALAKIFEVDEIPVTVVVKHSDCL